jgi:tetratricopeptide (TPR) repeat protein
MKIMKLKNIATITILLLFIGLSNTYAQKTTVFTEANSAFKEGLELFDKGVYGAAQTQFKRAMALSLPENEVQSQAIYNKAKLYLARCAVRQNLPDGEKLMLDFVRDAAPDPASNEALIELANYYFNARDYVKAIEYYNSVPVNGLSAKDKSEVLFRMGYSYFAQKQFAKAKSSFDPIRNLQTEYYYPTNYYLGLIHFFEGNYSAAISNFQIVERSGIRKYTTVLPFYVTQIYFAEGKYNDVLDYAIPKLNQGGIKDLKEIYQLVGQAYFEKREYRNALPYLEYFAEQSSKMREEEFYQLGFVYMETEQPAKAIKYFEELNTVDSELGQNAAYNLGRLYLQTKDYSSARSAFARASRMTYNAQVQENALFNFAKLSYELKYDTDAITALQQIKTTSRYYIDSQSLMSKIFLDTRDYERAIAIMRSLPSLTPELRETLQRVIYFRGLQLYQTGNKDQAKQYFSQSLETPIHQATKALATFWLGEIAHGEKKYAESIQFLNQFLTIARSLKGLPDESSVPMANYIQGYNYLKQENYAGALDYFKNAVSDIKRNSPFIASQEVKDKILGDAVLRAGDCLFKRNQYAQAIQYYDEAIDRKYAGFVYALYQKAIIEGLRSNTTAKILALERIVDNYPRSPYADDALLQLGVTYQEIGKLAEASKPLQRLVREYKDKSNLVNPALIQLGLISYNQGQKETAINYYKQIFGNNPEANEAQTALKALEEIYVNDLGNADAYFAFLKTIPGYDITTLGRDSINFRAAEAQFENANYKRAIENYSNYIANFPNGRSIILAYYRRGDSHSALKLYTNALADYEWVVKKGTSAYYKKALEKAAIIAYNHEQNFKKSYDFYAKLEEVADNSNLQLEAQLGALRSAYRANMTNEVYSLAKKVAENSLATQDQAALANFYFGKISYDRKNYDDALKSFQLVIDKSDTEQAAEARYLIAYIYYLRRNLEKAQEITINSNRESSRYPYWVAKSIILLSDILAEKGDLFNSRAALEALLENYKGDQEVIQTAKDKLAQINRRIQADSRIDRSTDNFLDSGGGE